MELGLLAGRQLNMSQPRSQVAKGANDTLACTRNSVAITYLILPLYSSLVGLCFGLCVRFWAPQFRKDPEVLEHIQRRPKKLVKGLECIMHGGK